jgi:hypothetical protein
LGIIEPIIKAPKGMNAQLLSRRRASVEGRGSKKPFSIMSLESADHLFLRNNGNHTPQEQRAEITYNELINPFIVAIHVP